MILISVLVFVDKEQSVGGAIYVGDELKIGDKLLFNLGVRYAFFTALGSGTQRTYQDGLPRNESTVQDTISYSDGDLIETNGGPEARVSA